MHKVKTKCACESSSFREQYLYIVHTQPVRLIDVIPYFFAIVKMGQGPKQCKPSLVSNLECKCFWLKFFMSALTSPGQSAPSIGLLYKTTQELAMPQFIYMAINLYSQFLMQSGCRGELWSSTYTTSNSDMKAQYKWLSPTYAVLSCDTN